MSGTPEQKAPSGLAQRAVTGVVLAVAVLVVLWLPVLCESRGMPVTDSTGTTMQVVRVSIWASMAFTAVAALFVALGFREYAAMVRQKGIAIPATAGAIAVAAIVFTSGFFGPLFDLNALGTVTTLAIVLLAWLHILRGMEYHTLPGLAATILGVIYLGWMPAHLIVMHVSGHTGLDPSTGPGIVTFLIAIVAMSDSGAYFTGRAIGKHKLAPHTSPKKTWEGAFGGVIAAMLTGGVMYVLRTRFDLHAQLPDYPLWWYLLTGAILSVVSQIGDLVESMLKRDAGVKDSGTIFPGHGGVLDRCDGILFAAPALYYLIQLEHGVQWLQQPPM